MSGEKAKFLAVSRDTVPPLSHATLNQETRKLTKI